MLPHGRDCWGGRGFTFGLRLVIGHIGTFADTCVPQLLRFQWTEADADHIVVGVGSGDEFDAGGGIEHAAFDDDGDFDGLKIFGAGTDGIGPGGKFFEWHEVTPESKIVHGVGNLAGLVDQFNRGRGPFFAVF